MLYYNPVIRKIWFSKVKNERGEETKRKNRNPPATWKNICKEMVLCVTLTATSPSTAFVNFSVICHVLFATIQKLWSLCFFRILKKSTQVFIQWNGFFNVSLIVWVFSYNTQSWNYKYQTGQIINLISVCF